MGGGEGQEQRAKQESSGSTLRRCVHVLGWADGWAAWAGVHELVSASGITLLLPLPLLLLLPHRYEGHSWLLGDCAESC